MNYSIVKMYDNVSIYWPVVEIWVVYSLGLCTAERKEWHECILKRRRIQTQSPHTLLSFHSYKILESPNYNDNSWEISRVHWKM